MISLELCGGTEVMPILRLVMAFILAEIENYFELLAGQNKRSTEHKGFFMRVTFLYIAPKRDHSGQYPVQYLLKYWTDHGPI